MSNGNDPPSTEPADGAEPDGGKDDSRRQSATTAARSLAKRRRSQSLTGQPSTAEQQASANTGNRADEPATEASSEGMASSEDGEGRPRRSGGGWFGGFIGGIIGTLATFAVLYFLVVEQDIEMPLLSDLILNAQAPSPEEGPELPQDIRSNLQELSQRVDELGGGEQSVSALSQQVEEISTTLEQRQGLDPEALAALEERLSSVESSIDEVTDGAAFETRLEESLANLSEQSEARLGELEQRIQQQLNEVRGQIPQSVDLEPLQQAQAEVGEQLASVEERVDALAASVQELEGLRQELTTLGDDLSGRLEEQQQQTTSRLDSLTATIQFAAATALVDEIESAVAEGRSFSSSYEQLQEIAGGAEGLSQPVQQLQPAADGSPTLDELQSGLDQVAQSLSDQQGGGDGGNGGDGAGGGAGGGGFFGQTMQNLRGAVVPGGGGGSGAVQPARDALSNGDLGGAIEVVSGLQSTEAVQQWLERARARQSAQAAVRSLDKALRERLLASN